MTALPQSASVHPATLTAHSQGQRPLLRVVPTHTSTRPRRPAHRVTTLTVHPEVWKQALAAAAGDATRIEVHDATHITVHNRSIR